MYNAIITKVVNVREHSNADTLKLGTAAGCQVVIGKDVEEGTTGVFFSEGGCLSEEMCRENNLYRHTELNKDATAKAGFFENNARIRTVKLRGEKSEGFWTSLDVLEWTGTDLSSLKDGQEFTKLNGKLVCEKYYTKATLEAMQRSRQGVPGKKKVRPLEDVYSTFKKHFSTSHLGRSLGTIPKGAVLHITEKCHGTSGRTGYLEEDLQLSKFKQWWNKHLPMKFATKDWQYVSGSRKVVFDPHKAIEDGYYVGTTYRELIHKEMSNRGLHKGETLYYEIVGYTEKGSLIMGNHGVEDKAVRKLYGKNMAYTYGCNPDGSGKGLFQVLLYRMTRTSPSGQCYEVPYAQMVTRAKELGIQVVPELKAPFIYNGDPKALVELCDELIKGHSTLDERHIKEGVVVRIEAPNKETFLKHKGFNFIVLEGRCKENNDYIDAEEIA